MKSSRALFLSIIIIELIIFLFMCRAFFWFTPDDGYIYLSGARQIAGGTLPNFCPGEPPTNFFGSMPWTFILTVPYLLHLDPLIFGKILGLALLLMSTFVLSRILDALAQLRNGFVALSFSMLLVCFPPAVIAAVNLLDTMLAVLGAVLTVFYLIKFFNGRGCFFKLGLSLSLLLTSRPHTFVDVFFVLIMIAWFLNTRSEEKSKPALKILAGLLPGIIIAVGTVVVFKEILPNSAAAKISYSLTNQPKIVKHSSYFSLYLGRIIKDLSRDNFLFVAYLAIIPFIIMVKNRFTSLSIAALAFTHLGVYMYHGDWMSAHRIWMPSLFIVMACFFFVLIRFFEDKRRLVILLALLIPLFTMNKHSWLRFVSYVYITPDSDEIKIGKIIRKHKMRDSWLITPDMGATVYYANMPTIDACDEPICNKYRLTHFLDMEYVTDHQIDFVVLVSREKRKPRAGKEVLHLLCQKFMSTSYFKLNFVHFQTGECSPRWQGYKERNSRFGKGRYYHLYVSKRALAKIKKKERMKRFNRNKGG